VHVTHTGSEWGQEILEDFRTFLPKFWVVKPKAAELGTLIDSLRQAA
jgi:glutamate synthase (NADPH/NADH) large chain